MGFGPLLRLEWYLVYCLDWNGIWSTVEIGMVFGPRLRLERYLGRC